MKKAYRTPIAKKIEYEYQEQVVAQSLPIQQFVDAWETGVVCTWGDATCSVVYNVPTKARGLNDCLYPGNIPLPGSN